MVFVLTAVVVGIALLVLYYRQLLLCLDLIEKGRIQAPKPNPMLFNRATKEFLDFVLKGKYRSSKDVAVLRSYGLLRVTLLAQLLLLVIVLVYVLVFF